MTLVLLSGKKFQFKSAWRFKDKDIFDFNLLCILVKYHAKSPMHIGEISRYWDSGIKTFLFKFPYYKYMFIFITSSFSLFFSLSKMFIYKYLLISLISIKFLSWFMLHLYNLSLVLSIIPACQHKILNKLYFCSTMFSDYIYQIFSTFW